MKTETIGSSESIATDYLIETQAYIETLKNSLIEKIVTSKGKNSENSVEVNKLFEEILGAVSAHASNTQGVVGKF